MMDYRFGWSKKERRKNYLRQLGDKLIQGIPEKK
jgi:hypothetical protein